MDISRQYKGKVQRTAYAGELLARYDVIVAGLGTAGAVAAIAAARKGLKVLAVERLHGMGGAGTAGAVLNYYFGTRGGLFEQLDQEAMQLERSGGFTPSVGVNAETKMLVMEQEALEAGVSIQYDSSVTGVLMHGNKVTGIEWVSAEGRFAAEAAVVIDCTGDAEVCAAAGCSFRGGREFDGQAQPFSNVYVYMDEGRVRYKYTDSGYVDPRDAADMSRAILESAVLSTHLRPRYEENGRMLRIAPLLGLREGRFIIGEDSVTLQDYLNGRYAEEPIFYAYSNIDNHSKDVAFESEIQQKWTVACSMWGYNFTVPIPLGALIPRGMDGLLVAGRCLAVDHDMAACVRMKRDMQKSGEAAAYAAYLALKRAVPLREVPYAELSELLQESGCLKAQERVIMKETLSHADETNPIVQWLSDTEQIRQGLGSDKPGLAIWSAVRLGAAIHPQLMQWASESVDTNLGKHSAFALALLGEAAAAPILREMARMRDPYVPKTSRKYNQARGYTAIFLLGLLADAAALPLLYEILQDQPSNFDYHDENKEFLADRNELYFQYVSFTVMALARIGERHESKQAEIAAACRKLLARSDLRLTITFKGSSDIRHEMNGKIRQAAEQTVQRWGMAL